MKSAHTVGACWPALMMIACGGVSPEPQFGFDDSAFEDALAQPVASASPSSRDERSAPTEASSIRYTLDPVKQLELAKRYFDGQGVERDSFIASRWAFLAAEKGHTPALSWLEQNAEGDAFAGFWFSYYFGMTSESQRDLGRAKREWARIGPEIQRRADAADPRALLALGITKERGFLTEEDTTQAYRYYRQSADTGYAASQFAVGNCFQYGSGIQPDLAEAASWYKKAAEQGHPEGQLAWGYALDEGRGVPVDDVAAALWYAKSAEAGVPTALNNLGVMYINGIGVDRDVARGIQLYEAAAAAGAGIAMSNLADLLYRGELVARDALRAEQLWEQAVEHDYAPAREVLAKAREIRRCLQTASTELFDVKLACGERVFLRRAVVQVGGKVQRVDDSYWFDIYQSEGLLVDSEKLSVGYTGDGYFALAEYDFGTNYASDELDRTLEMLIPRYGQPKLTRNPNENVATWTQRDGIVIELVRTPSEMYLRYIEPKRKAQLDQEIADDKAGKRRREVESQSAAF